MKIDKGQGGNETLSATCEEASPAPFHRRVVLENFDDAGLTAGARDIHILLPDGYDQSDHYYPVVYFNDGQAVFSGTVVLPGTSERRGLEVDLTYDTLIQDDLIDPAILVAIHFVKPGRIEDMTPAESGGNLDGYYRFVSERLKPYIDSHYRTRPEPASTGIIGISLGGLAAFLMAYFHPDTFGLAGCMSSSLWYGNRCALKMLREDEGSKKAVRFWLDAGGTGGEYSMWVDNVRVCERLEQLGWRFGDDLAAHFDYAAAHVMAAWRERMRPMLYFLLRKEPLRFLHYRLVYAVDPAAPFMDLRAGNRRIVGAEAWYANDLRLNVPQPGITIDDTRVVTLDRDDPILLHGEGPGETTIRSNYKGCDASLEVIGYETSAWPSYYPCPKRNNDLLDLSHDIRDEAQNAIAHFGVWHDERHVHIDVHVTGGSIHSEPETNPLNQDSIWFCLDARPEHILCRGEGYDIWEQFLNVCMSPGNLGEPINIRSSHKSDDWKHFMPFDMQAACVITAPVGYKTTLSVPIHYLDEMQGVPWRVFRLNICINRVDEPGSSVRRTWWQPEWHTFLCPVASGLFARV
ncbi:MAG: alpha/beta hydrolase-fold protein [Armatimonas sp.]